MCLVEDAAPRGQQINEPSFSLQLLAPVAEPVQESIVDD